MFCRNSEERIWLAKYRLNKSPRQGTDFPIDTADFRKTI